MRRLKNSRGSALAIVMILIFLLTVWGQAILLSSINESWIARKYANSTKAFWLADAGIQRAVWEYNRNNCQGFVQQGTSTPCTNCVCANVSKSLAASLTDGDYDILMNSINSNVISTGSYPNRTTPLAQRILQLNSGSVFQNALFAKKQVSIGNIVTVDSYSSSNGVYGAGNVFNNGGVASNGTTVGVINLGNNATIDGNVSTGPGGTVTEGNGASITGSITHANNMLLSNVSVPSSLTGLPSLGNLVIPNNQTQTISASSKYTSITMGEGSTLNISGNVSLYLTGPSAFATGNNGIQFNIPNGSSLTVYTDGTFIFGNNAAINNASEIASHFVINSTYTGANGVQLSNNQDTAVAVYAPNTDVSINNGGTDFYGAVIGQTITVSGSNNTKIHFDQALAGTINSSTKTWQEIL